ncbi:tRNA (adenosine(37)-N6)-dimethylallyltransferase MiaA [Blattabacterium cuenoti]|uniref:tRNA (adenosine(37)-N6)-dimethylallyltransferase MiaA n=1 Tax=Blattabacterium cuenoti TaxID=1653831 RepID=UPI001EEA564B|nr:tRNA (adenosine(37)-N6)-dimethylallyltransferase MiaA [Blattabacterium cuenoti]
MKKNLITIVGPTCVGKTNLSIFLAKQLKTEILSSDSRQFYKELKIGTSLPSLKELKSVPHHFIGHLSIHQYYNAKLFERDSQIKINELFKKYSILIMVGGSGLYEKAVIEGLSDIPNININIRNDLIVSFKEKGIKYLQKEFFQEKEKYHLKNIDINNPIRLIRYLEIIKSTGKSPDFFFKKNKKKINFYPLKIGLILSKKKIFHKINKRVDNMIKNGLLLESKNLYPYKGLNSLETIGYKEIFDFLDKKNNYKFSDVVERIKINTRKYVKKQLTWYKKCTNINWFNPEEKYKILEFIIKKIK